MCCHSFNSAGAANLVEKQLEQGQINGKRLMNDVTTAKAIKSWDELRKFLVELTFLSLPPCCLEVFSLPRLIRFRHSSDEQSHNTTITASFRFFLVSLSFPPCFINRRAVQRFRFFYCCYDLRDIWRQVLERDSNIRFVSRQFPNSRTKVNAKVNNTVSTILLTNAFILLVCNVFLLLL